MYRELGGKHHSPHLHAEFQGTVNSLPVIKYSIDSLLSSCYPIKDDLFHVVADKLRGSYRSCAFMKLLLTAIITHKGTLGNIPKYKDITLYGAKNVFMDNNQNKGFKPS